MAQHFDNLMWNYIWWNYQVEMVDISTVFLSVIKQIMVMNIYS